MKIEDQVCSLEIAKRLKELGVKQESEFYHVERHDGTQVILHLDTDCNNPAFFPGYKKEVIAAFTVAELGEMLPVGYFSQLVPPAQWVCFDDKGEHGQTERIEADARAKMLIHLIEKGLVTT